MRRSGAVSRTTARARLAALSVFGSAKGLATHRVLADATDVNPMTAVAEGAAVFAESIDWSSASRGRKSSRGAVSPGGSLDVNLTNVMVAGNEAAGVVDAVGQGVTELKVGDRVAYTGLPGSYCDLRIVPADRPPSSRAQAGVCFYGHRL